MSEVADSGSLDAFLNVLYRFRPPEMTCVKGCYIIASGMAGDDELVKDWIQETHGDLRQAEMSCNHRHIVSDFLYDLNGDWESADIAYVQLIYASLLENELKARFPSVEFDVIKCQPNNADDLDGYIVTFARK